MRKERHNYRAEDKVVILKKHLLERVAVSDICDEYKLQPKVFYNWQKQLFENGALAFRDKEGKAEERREMQEKVQALEEKLKRKHEVLSEVMEEHVKLKKAFREL